MKKVNPTIIALGVGIVLLLFIIALLWLLTEQVPFVALRVWAIVLTLGVLPVFAGGWYFGKTEVRGFLAGADHMIDRSMQVFTRAVDYRDSSLSRRVRDALPPAKSNPDLMRQMFQMPLAPSAPPNGSGEVEL